VRFDATVDGRTLRVEVRAGNGRYAVVVDGRLLEVDLVETGGAFASLLVEGHSHEVALEPQPGGLRVHLREAVVAVGLAEAASGAAAPVRRPSGPARVLAPMPGRVVRLLVAPDAEVEAGQGLAVIEAMKMENELRAPRSGRVLEVAVREGQAVDAGALLLVIA
jgi:biotin carboxyl carrier protein